MDSINKPKEVWPTMPSTLLAQTNLPQPSSTVIPTLLPGTIIKSSTPKLPVQQRSPARGTLKTLPLDLQQDQKRRSSSRSIKRKRFDDEIVEYSLVPQNRNNSDPHRVGRPRTISQTHHQIIQQAQQQGQPAVHLPVHQVVQIQNPSQPPAATPILPTVSNVLPTVSNITNTSPIAALPVNEIKSKPVTPEIKKTISSPVISVAPTVSTPVVTPVVTTLGVVNPVTPSTPNVATVNLPPPTHTLPSVTFSPERRRPGRTSRRTRRTGRATTHMATKDLGRWKPTDDLALIFAVQQTNDLRIIQRAVKFSCRFTLQELQARWNSLMFEPTISRLAVVGIRNLHPQMIEAVQNKALFSVQEEDLLSQIKSTDNPKLEQFQELLNNNAMIFFPSRTAKSLQNHWCEMKQYELLCDQVIKPQCSDGKPMTFSDAEDLILDGELSESRDEALEIELRLQDRQQKRQIRILETELSRWNVLVDSITNSNIAPDFDSQTLAILRGRAVRYLMRSKEITFGRTTKDSVVDVDLTLEGPAIKISRRQGTIKLRSNGDFFISNEGKRAIFINGGPLLNGSKTRLFHNAVLEKSFENQNNKKSDVPTTLADLTAACGEKILNPEFLLQGGNQPFADQKHNQNQQQQETNKNSLNNNNDEATFNKKLDNIETDFQDNNDKNIVTKVTTNQNLSTTATPLISITTSTTSSVTSSTNTLKTEPTASIAATIVPTPPTTSITAFEEEPFEFMLKKPVITLYSQKMKGLNSNSHQSQSNTIESTTNSQQNTNSHSDSIAVSRPKRTRRE